MASDSLSNMFKIFHLLLDGIVPGIGTGLPSCSAAIARDSSRALELDGSIIVMDGDGETGPKYEVSQRERAARTALLLGWRPRYMVAPLCWATAESATIRKFVLSVGQTWIRVVASCPDP